MLGRLGAAAALGFLTALALPAAAADQTVSFGTNLAYSPAEVHIAAGEKVTFTPDAGHDFVATPGSTHHPLDFVDPSIPDQASGSASVARTFAQPGTYVFFCDNHGRADGTGMAGRVVVEIPATATGTTTTTGQTTGTTVSTTQTTTSGPTTTTQTPVPGTGEDRTGPVVALKRLTLRGLGRRAATIRFSSSEAGSASATLSARGIVLARGAKTFRSAGTKSLSLRVTKAGRGLLRRAARVKARLRVTVRDTAGNATRLARSVVVRA